MDEEPMEGIRPENENILNTIVDARDKETGAVSRDTSVHSPMQNINGESIRHQHPTAVEDVTSMNQAQLTHSRNFDVSAVYNRIVDARDKETGAVSRDTSVHSPMQNLDGESIRHQHPTAVEDVTSMNQAQLMHSRNFGVSAVYNNINKTDASESYALPGTSSGSLRYDEIDNPFKFKDSHYRKTKNFSSNSSESSESDTSAVSVTGSLAWTRFLFFVRKESERYTNSEHSGNPCSSRISPAAMNPLNTHALKYAYRKVSRRNYKEKVLEHFFKSMRTSVSSSIESISAENEPSRKVVDPDEEYFPDAESSSSSSTDYQNGIASSYKYFGGIDYPKDVHSVVSVGAHSNYDSMECQWGDVIQGTKRGPQSDTNSLIANWSDSSDSYEDCGNKTEILKLPSKRTSSESLPDDEQIGASNLHKVINDLKQINTASSLIEKPIVVKKSQHDSTPDFRETKVSELKTSRKSSMGKCRSFSESQIEPILTAKEESSDNSRELCKGKRKMDSSKDSHVDDRQEKFLKTI